MTEIRGLFQTETAVFLTGICTRGVKGKPKCLKRYNLENYFDLLKKKIK
jgi:hypothetical protein